MGFFFVVVVVVVVVLFIYFYFTKSPKYAIYKKVPDLKILIVPHQLFTVNSQVCTRSSTILDPGFCEKRPP